MRMRTGAEIVRIRSRVGINNDPFPGWQPISSLPLAEIPVFQELCSCTISSMFHKSTHSARLEPGSLLRGLGYAGHLCRQGQHFFLSPFLPSPWRRLIISLLQIPKEVVGGGCGIWDAEVMWMGDKRVKGGVGRDP
jgi:hypothetical protein